MICPDCKTELPDNASYCRECGEVFPTSREKIAQRRRGCLKITCLIVIGIPLAIWFVMENCVEFAARATDLRAMWDMRTIATGLEAYNVDFGVYPAWSEEPELPSKMKYPIVLTTPIAFLTSMQLDPFAPQKGSTYSYYSAETTFILWSAGPDRDYDLDPLYLRDVAKFGESEEIIELHDFNYDPSNGVESSGDIYQTGGSGTNLITPSYTEYSQWPQRKDQK